jgi:aryl-alcohol dehydrogenase-like predicted oxidoreductase
VINGYATEDATEAFDAVASIYAEKAVRRVNRIRRVMAAADPGWAAEGTLSQKALRAVRSTPGVTCVLVGMRRKEYVSDVLAELRRPIIQDRRLESWQTLTAELANTAL